MVDAPPWPSKPPLPSWVEGGVQETGGLDLLGLRQPAQAVSNYLLDGVTTVTPRVRYLSIRAWIIHRYIQARGPESATAFGTFAAAAESAVVLGNLLNDPSLTGLIGSIDGAKRIQTESDTLALDKLVEGLAIGVYQGPSLQLGLSPFKVDSLLQGLTRERGLPLALAMDRELRGLALSPAFLQVPAPTVASRADLLEWGRALLLTRISPDERELLISTLCPEIPLDDGEARRLATYGLLLGIAQQLRRIPKDTDVFLDSGQLRSPMPGSLTRIRQGWLLYTVRDLIAVSHEYALAALVGELHGRAGHWATADDTIRLVLSRSASSGEILRELGLLDGDESVPALSMSTLRERVRAHCGTRLMTESGVTYWEGALSEETLCRAISESGDGAVALLPLVWIVLTERIEPGGEGADGPGPDLSGVGWARLGIDAILRPFIDAQCAAGASVASTASQLALRTVEQHLRIAWARLSEELGGSAPAKDVSLLRSDDDRWQLVGPRGFQGGRTDSRLTQAINWLTQLSLVDDAGLTSDGQRVYDRILHTLGNGYA